MGKGQSRPQTLNHFGLRGSENCSGKHNHEIAGAIPAPATLRLLASLVAQSKPLAMDVERGVSFLDNKESRNPE